MNASGVHKCYFCFVDSNGQLTYNGDYLNNLIPKLTTFWKNNIYPILLCRNTGL